MGSKEETMNLEDTTPTSASQFVMGFNELSNPPMAPSSTQYV